MPVLAAGHRERQRLVRMLRRLRMFEDWPDPELEFMAYVATVRRTPQVSPPSCSHQAHGCSLWRAAVRAVLRAVACQVVDETGDAWAARCAVLRGLYPRAGLLSSTRHGDVDRDSREVHSAACQRASGLVWYCAPAPPATDRGVHWHVLLGRGDRTIVEAVTAPGVVGTLELVVDKAVRMYDARPVGDHVTGARISADRFRKLVLTEVCFEPARGDRAPCATQRGGRAHGTCPSLLLDVAFEPRRWQPRRTIPRDTCRKCVACGSGGMRRAWR